MIKIGYACLTIGVPYTNFKSCIMKNATESRLMELISHNLNSLENIIDYNIKNGIKLFRMSSDIIPFGSNPINQLDWKLIFKDDFNRIGNMILKSGMRVSMHPGQYTVLNSPDGKVVENAIRDLRYHNKFLEALGCDSSNKIILHLGGVYGNKESAIKRFNRNYSYLGDSIKRRLVIENDDRSFSICDLLETSVNNNIPIVYDNLHNKVNGYSDKSDLEWINLCSKTWGKHDGRQKIHYSQQNPQRQPGAHSKTIAVSEFLEFYKVISNLDIDIMLEVKDKNVSAVKCTNTTQEPVNYGMLQRDWARYKYYVMEKSPSYYRSISKLFQNNDFKALDFYRLVEEAINEETRIGNSINALEHVWGYFKNLAEEKDLKKFQKSINLLRDGKIKVSNIKNFLYKLALVYKSEYLINSYFFHY